MCAKLNTVLLIHGVTHRESALDTLRKFIEKNFSNYSAHFLLVDNSICGGVEISLAPDVSYISGDNDAWEFSGYDTGVNWYEQRRGVEKADIFLIANDTFHRSYGTEYLENCTKKRVAFAVRKKGILGHIDAYPKPIKICDYSLQSWIRSSFFILPYSALEKIKPLALQMPKNRIFGEWPPDFFRANAPLSENYQRYIKTWLFEEAATDTEFAFEWHSKKALNETTYPDFVRKTWCILCEHMLSAKAVHNGAPLIPIVEAGGKESALQRLKRRLKFIYGKMK